MAVVTSDFLSGLFTTFHAVWEQAFLAATSVVQYQRYITEVTSDTDTESYNWLGTVPQMREWTDVRQLNGLPAYNFSIQNKKYEDTIEVNRTTLADDKYNSIMPRIQQLGQEAARYPAVLAAQLLTSGATSLAYDGSNFFDTTHSEGTSGTQSNKLTGTGVTLAAVRADLVNARTTMRRYKDNAGRPMNIAPDLVIIPPDLQDVFEQLINTNIIALSSGTQQSNVLIGAVDILVDANLTDVNDWFLLSTNNIMKPLIMQIREQATFSARDNPTDSVVFNTDKYAYGVRARWGFGGAFWSMAIQTTN